MIPLILSALLPIQEGGAIHYFTEAGWNSGRIERSSIDYCPKEVNIDAIRSKASAAYKLDRLSKFYPKMHVADVQCMKGAEIILVTVSIVGSPHVEGVYMMNGSGDLIGKFVFSSRFNRVWHR